MSDRTCPYCQSSMGADTQVETCPTCEAGYHDDCWAEATGCVVPGCVGVSRPSPSTVPVPTAPNGHPATASQAPTQAPSTQPQPQSTPSHLPNQTPTRPSGLPPQPAAASPTLPPPGWYQDPSGRYDTRWWNGRSWTPDVQLRGIRLNDPPPGWNQR